MGEGTRSGAGKRFVMAVGLAVCAAVAGSALAQPQQGAKPAGPEQAMRSDTVIRTETRTVLVDAVVTDKKGHYITDLTQENFKVYEDNKEQPITSFTSGSDPAVQNAGQKHYMILFFDNSSMQMRDQMQAREAAAKFIGDSAGPDHLMAVVNFGGSLVIRQNFTANAQLLKAAVSGASVPHVESNAQPAQPVMVATLGMPAISNAEADFGATSMLLSIRSLAKDLRAVPGRKMLILFTAGFPLTIESESELTATIDACNKANVAVYPLDVRGLAAGTPGGSAMREPGGGNASPNPIIAEQRSGQIRPRLVLASYSAAAALEPQKPGGGGAGGGGGRPGGGMGGGGGRPGGGMPGGGIPGGGGRGGTGGAGGTGAGGGKGGAGAGAGGGGGRGGAGGGGGVARPPMNYGNYYSNPMNQPQVLLPKLPATASENQQVMQMLADGTGGFTIYNTNDLLGGLQRIAQEMNQFYVLGYTPPTTTEGSCHALKVKLNKGGMEIRSRTGYCNVRPVDPLIGKPIERQMEAQANGSTAGSIRASMQAPYFYAAPNVARVNLAMEIPGEALLFNKEKGKYHANVNVLGIAYKPDGTVGARFSDTLDLEMEKGEWKEFTKKPYRYENQFDAAPGTYKLAVVLSSGGEGFARMETPLQIDSYDGNRFTLGGVVLSANMQRVDDIPTEMDATLLEDRKPLIVKGIQITPSANYQFKKSENVALYSELYEPLLKTDPATRVLAGYRIFDQATNKEVFFTGAVELSDFVQKGNPVVPFALKVDTKDLPPGNYRLVLLAVDGKNDQAPQRPVEFTLSN